MQRETYEKLARKREEYVKGPDPMIKFKKVEKAARGVILESILTGLGGFSSMYFSISICRGLRSPSIRSKS